VRRGAADAPHGAREGVWLRALCFALCVPSGGSLLAKVYGLAPMPVGALWVALPCSAALVAVWLWAARSGRRPLADALAIGFAGGLLGTLAYDVVRVPFHLAGQRIFAPISAYGVWIADAAASSRFTEVVGWAYHFSNGITFGVMYTIWVRGRHWGWAILWGLTLETIALASPFAEIFHLSGNYRAIGIAYLGHVAYGLPLGVLAQRWEATRDYLAALPGSVKWTAALMAAVALAGPLVTPELARRDARAVAGEFRVEGSGLNPDWLRLDKGGAVRVLNPEPARATVVVRQTGQALSVEGGGRAEVTFDQPGVYQLFVQSAARTRSSFVIVEPVEQVR
jgi:hypothetical protein